jgi:hypothetical protein
MTTRRVETYKGWEIWKSERSRGTFHVSYWAEKDNDEINSLSVEGIKRQINAKNSP